MIDEWFRKDNEKEGEKKWPLKGKKSQYILVIIICLGLLALIWPISQVEKEVSPASEPDKMLPADNSKKRQLTVEVESILSQIEGAGKVNVSIIMDSEGVKTYASNIRDEKREIQETDSSGTRKQTVEESKIRDLAVSAGAPLLLEEKTPKVLGILVVAEGARIPEVKERLTNAAVTLLNIAPHRVRVVSRKGAS
jgi:stage III sporulation protein AG